jgi:hypothetical protein
LTEKKRKKHFCEHCTHANPTANLTAQSQSQRGLREYKRQIVKKVVNNNHTIYLQSH